jgi:hypothetical protein
MTQMTTTILPSQAKPSQAKPEPEPELAGGWPGAWAGAALASIADRRPLPDRRATPAGGIPNRSFIDSCSRIFHGGYRPKWHIKASVDATPPSAGPRRPDPWPALRWRCAPVAARLTLQDALHRIRLCKRCNSRRDTVVCSQFTSAVCDLIVNADDTDQLFFLTNPELPPCPF